MSTAKKKAARKAFKKKTGSTVVVFEKNISTEETLFPEKVAEAKKILRNAKFLDPRFDPKSPCSRY